MQKCRKASTWVLWAERVDEMACSKCLNGKNNISSFENLYRPMICKTWLRPRKQVRAAKAVHSNYTMTATDCFNCCQVLLCLYLCSREHTGFADSEVGIHIYIYPATPGCRGINCLNNQRSCSRSQSVSVGLPFDLPNGKSY